MDSYISFIKDDQVASVSMTMDNSITWMELTEQFYGFMIASGYVLDREDFAEYIIESTYGSNEVYEATDDFDQECVGCGECENCECNDQPDPVDPRSLLLENIQFYYVGPDYPTSSFGR